MAGGPVFGTPKLPSEQPSCLGGGSGRGGAFAVRSSYHAPSLAQWTQGKKKKESGVRAPSGTSERRKYPTINPTAEFTAM